MNRFDNIAQYYFDHHLSDMNVDRFWKTYAIKEEMMLERNSDKGNENDTKLF
ncbi:hypothetical protein [Budvicia aquatica]|uniref:Uncharacterized protein n=1 Tax=Budvicia aquatica TaxID=82979 RepID=A0A484ZXK5_9GAMM|nr:hypothetical protein [Budvicia aquatica]VFS52448.1 Uncharacterised protein [Budvicia aquatica]